MKVLKIQDYDMPALVQSYYENTTNVIDIPKWEPVLLGSIKKVPVYFYKAENQHSKYPHPELNEVESYEMIVQYRKEYGGFILSLAI